METNIIDFDMAILEVLDSVIREHELARTGRLGREMQMVFGMEMWGEGIEKIKNWREVVAGRLGVQDQPVVKEYVAPAVRRPLREGRVGDRRYKGGMKEARWDRTENEDVKKDGESEDVPFVDEPVTAGSGPAERTTDREPWPRAVSEGNTQFGRPSDETRDEESGDIPAKVLL